MRAWLPVTEQTTVLWSCSA